LSITKSDFPDPVIAGTELEYDIILHNAGPADAVNVVVTDVLDTDTTFKSIDVPTGWTCTTPSVGFSGAVECKNPSFGGGLINILKLYVMVNDGVTDGAQLSNSISAATESTDPDDTNNSDTVLTDVITRADLEVEKGGTVTGFAGAGSILYQAFITNHGPSDAQNAVLTDLLDPTIVKTDAYANGGGTCDGDPLVACTWATVPVNTVVGVVIEADLKPEALNLCNTADGTSDTTDPGPKPNSATFCLVVPTKSKLTLEQTAEIIGADQAIEYTFVIKNGGPSVARNVRLRDVLADATEFETVSTTAGTCNNHSPVRCKLGDIYPGVDNTIKIRVKIVEAVATVKNKGRLITKTFDPDLKDNVAKVKIPVGSGKIPAPIEPSNPLLVLNVYGFERARIE
jgi:uncharacterized repeat protein (TIGR01451 family)